MPVMARCPCYAWSEKMFRTFFVKNLRDFLDPPVRSSGAPWKGGLCPDPRDPPLGGSPPKKGSPLPARKIAKKVQFWGPNMPKMGILGPKMAIFGRILTIFDKFSKVSGELCREKNALRRRLSAVQKPANLYSTKCRFFGPPPPPGGYQCTECTSRGPRGVPTPLPGPVPKRGPHRTLPERLLHVALADGVIQVNYIIYMINYVYLA